MMRNKLLGKLLAAALCGGAMLACYARVETGGEECRTVVRNRHDVEVCRTRCGDEGCRTRCVDQERYSREHRCWVD